MKQTTNEQKVIPIFFTTDDNYVPYLCVAIKSIIAHCDPKLKYQVHVLNAGLSQDFMNKLKDLETAFLKIEFNDVSAQIAEIKLVLNENLRDYYSDAIFYRIFIPQMFPQYHKAIYIDCDVVVLTDIANLYNTDMQGNYLASVPDEVAPSNPVLTDYVENAVGIPINQYFCSGVILFDLDAMREHKVAEKFVGLLITYNFDTVAPDQDYLNVICKDHVLYLNPGWDKQANDQPYDGELYLVHYNMFRKPWLYNDVPYEKYFWQYAKETVFYENMLQSRANYTDAQKQADFEGAKTMGTFCEGVLKNPMNFKKVLTNRSIDEAIKNPVKFWFLPLF